MSCMASLLLLKNIFSHRIFVGKIRKVLSLSETCIALVINAFIRISNSLEQIERYTATDDGGQLLGGQSRV